MDDFLQSNPSAAEIDVHPKPDIFMNLALCVDHSHVVLITIC